MLKSAVDKLKSNKSKKELYPTIFVSGVVGDISFHLKQRGFIPEYSLPNGNNTSSVVATVSPKLFMKIAIELGFSSKEAALADEGNMSRVGANAVGIVQRLGQQLKIETKKEPFLECWVIHDSDKLKKIGSLSGSEQCDQLNNYFGSKISLYFSWLSFYTNYLVIPAISGTLLFSYQIYTGKVDTIWSPFYMLLIVIWGTCFLEFWKRENSLLCFKWHVFDADEKQTDKDLYEVFKIFLCSIFISY